jgi:hypothetical protein
MGGENETNFSEVNKKITNINATWRLELCMIARNENQKSKKKIKIKITWWILQVTKQSKKRASPIVANPYQCPPIKPFCNVDKALTIHKKN